MLTDPVEDQSTEPSHASPPIPPRQESASLGAELPGSTGDTALAGGPRPEQSTELDRRGFIKAERGEPLEPLDAGVLKGRSLETSPSGYLSIVSIIQGAGFAFLVESLFERFTFISAFHAVAIMCVLVLVFHYYTILSILLRWATSILDSVLPFVIGGLEIPPVFLLGKSDVWSYWVAAFWFSIAFGAVTTKLWSPPGHFGADKQDQTTKQWAAWEHFAALLKLTLVVGLCSGLIVLVCGLVARYYIGSATSMVILSSLATIGGVLAIAIPMEWKLSRIYNCYGVPRSLFN